ncbi:DUF4148 domain-containing protein [Paraburkholderia sp. Tr-20389]|uniref:DUF4148 domain-containing protein n=1 Tax=Paraburkholderia sp. Tr-20389 TaxID=2703903 RepID=UPI00197EEBA1|nr:DUF4148 domain-containing protein [Paraburkholderia sp. Tr-20389]MBN3755008.1 DUF4148 domain-containing protein [Paraburkholderia sp. Tr-20389]
MMGALACCVAMTASAQTVSTGKTRAEVRAELVQAQREGLVPAPKHNYPPSAEEIRHNAEVYAIQHGGGDTRTAMQTPANASVDNMQ